MTVKYFLQEFHEIFLQVSQNSSLKTVKEDTDKSAGVIKPNNERKSGVFGAIVEMSEDMREEECGDDAKNDDNNNNEAENMNKNMSVSGPGLTAASSRRKESRKTSHFDIDTIMEEIDDLASKRDSSPSKHQTSKPLPKTPTELLQRKK